MPIITPTKQTDDSNVAKINRPREVPPRNEYHGFAVTFADITQRQLEQFYSELAANEKSGNVPLENRRTIRAAIRAGWFKVADADMPGLPENPADDPMLDWSPARVNWLARLITDKYLDVTFVDPT